MKKSEIAALIRLLDDPDQEIYQSVKNRLLASAMDCLPELKKAWQESKNELFLERSTEIISSIQFRHTLKEFKEWVNSGGQDLLTGICHISKYNFPDLEYDSLNKKIEAIKTDAWLQMADNLSPLEQIRVINHIIFNIHKFSRNNTDFYSPKNSYINLVLETKKGNPISLAIIYLMVTQKLGLPVYGVNLPKNFLLAYVEDLYNTGLETDLENKIVSFYVNPYNNGAVLTKREIDYFLKQQKIKPLDFFYSPCDNLTIVQRLLLNLIYAYERQKDQKKINDLKEFLTAFNQALPDIYI